MKTQILLHSSNNFTSLACGKIIPFHKRCRKQYLLIIAMLIFSFSLHAQVDPVSVNASAGTTGPTTYPNLKFAAEAVNNGTHQGIISINVIGNTTETSTVVFNASGTGTAIYSSISIQPAGGGARTVAGSVSSPLIDLNGADNLTIDGLNTGGNSLIISNTSPTTNTCTIRFLLDATYNTIKNCTISGSGTSPNSGIIVFSTGSSMGNSYNLIASNNISWAGTNLAANAIYSEGTSGNPNTGITISNNNIYNYTTRGIDVSSTGSGAWTITGNSFYKEAGVFDTYNSIPAVHAIRILGGSGYTVSNNHIGGEGSLLTGNNATYNSTGSLGITGIFLTTSNAVPASDIKGNTISKIRISTVSGAGTFYFFGIETSGSGINVGGSGPGEGNIIGSNAANGAVAISNSSSAPSSSSIFGIYFKSNGGIIQSNQVAGIDIDNLGSSPASPDFEGIKISLAPIPPSKVNNNIIGSETTPHSIRIMATSTATAPVIAGLYLGSSITSALPEVNGNIIQNISNFSAVSSGTFTGINTQNGYVQSYQNNTIRNIYASANSSASSLAYTGILSSTSLPPNTIIANNVIDNFNYQSSGINAQIRGMQISGSAPKITTISGNSISNLTTLSQKSALANTADPSLFAIVGLLFSTAGAGSAIFNNNFYNFSSLTTAVMNPVVAGIGIISPGSGNIYGNRMSGFTNTATGSANLPGIIGIKAFSGSFNVYNNSIRISNASFTNGVNIYGVVQNTPGTAWNYFHNSVSISGGSPAGNPARSAAFIRSTEGGLLFKNNVFVNTRTGSGTHYAISNIVASPSATWLSSSSNYNDLYSSNANTVAEWGTGVSNSFVQFKSNSGGEANSISSPVSFVTSDYDLETAQNSNCTVNNAGNPVLSPFVINTDLKELTRSASNPDLGAYEFTYIAPVHAASNDGPKCTGENVNLGVTPGPGIAPFTFDWSGPNSFSSTSQNPALSNVTPTMAGMYTVTLTDANGCPVNAQTNVAITNLPAGTLTSNVGNTIIMGSPVVFTATDGNFYDFMINGTSMQSGAVTTYTSSSLITGDIVTVAAGNSASCIVTYPGITMTVSSVVINGKKYNKWNGTKVKKWNGIMKVN